MKEYLTVAIRAAIEAGVAIMEIYATDFEIEIKGDASPLTAADKKANTIINSYLAQTPFPVISEENKSISYKERAGWTDCWIVDPLDGTKEFIKRNGEFTVNIALVSKGCPVLGVIYVPALKTLYFTAEDVSGAFKLVLQDETISPEVIFSTASEIMPASEITTPVKIVGSRSHLNEATRTFISEIEKENNVAIVSRGSSLKFCLVAEGAAHIYPRYAPTMEWDTAAGDAICRAVGISVIEEQTGRPLQYNKESLLNPNFVVRK